MAYEKNGAGGTSGGVSEFFIGLGLIIAGLYLFLNNITVSHTFSMHSALFHFRFGGGYQFGVQSGSLLIPFIIGISILFYDAKKILGWVLSLGSVVALIVGVLISLNFVFRPLPLMDLIIIVALLASGVGLFLKSLKPSK